MNFEFALISIRDYIMTLKISTENFITANMSRPKIQAQLNKYTYHVMGQMELTFQAPILGLQLNTQIMLYFYCCFAYIFLLLFPCLEMTLVGELYASFVLKKILKSIKSLFQNMSKKIEK